MTECNKRLLVHSAFEDYDVLIDRTTIWGNRYWEYGSTKDEPVNARVDAHLTQIQEDLNSGRIKLTQIAQLHGKVLGCHCCTPRNPDAPCHGRNLIAGAAWALQQISLQGRTWRFDSEDGSGDIITRFKNTRWYDGIRLDFLSNMYQIGQPRTITAPHERPGTDLRDVSITVESWCVESLYQAAKLNPHTTPDYFTTYFKVATMNGYEAKKFIRSKEAQSWLYDPEYWKAINRGVMYREMLEKYNVPELQEKLMHTRKAMLVETNWWGDDFYGFCLKTAKGSNYLGRMTMQIREMKTGVLATDLPPYLQSLLR